MASISLKRMGEAIIVKVARKPKSEYHSVGIGDPPRYMYRREDVAKFVTKKWQPFIEALFTEKLAFKVIANHGSLWIYGGAAASVIDNRLRAYLPDGSSITIIG